MDCLNLPNFLCLGPELTTQDQVDELKDLGRRILNMAAECDADDFDLRLRDVFELYCKMQSWKVALRNSRHGLSHPREPLDSFPSLYTRPRMPKRYLTQHWLRLRTGIGVQPSAPAAARIIQMQQVLLEKQIS